MIAEREGRPGKIVCVGRNYADHARELDNEVPERPLIFLKPPSAVVGPGEAIVLPAASDRVEHEAEIGAVVARRLKGVDRPEAIRGLAGAVPANDVTARDLQRADGQWTRAKGFDTFCPLGADVVPLDSADAWRSLEVTCRVNGELRQHGRAADMVFDVARLVSYVSGIMTLEPGDVVLTGTPAGVGPLEEGDEVTVEIPGVGEVANPVARP